MKKKVTKFVSDGCIEDIVNGESVRGRAFESEAGGDQVNPITIEFEAPERKAEITESGFKEAVKSSRIDERLTLSELDDLTERLFGSKS